MTDANPTGSPYCPADQDHLCDQAIDYDAESLTIDFTTDDCGTAELTGVCDVCGRVLSVLVNVDVEMLRVADGESGEILHEY